jgi:hypothetical protein
VLKTKRKLKLFRKKYGIFKYSKNFSYECINWKYILKKYSGFAIYPLLDNVKDTFLTTYDCSTLVLWNYKPIIKYYDLGFLMDYIKIDSKIIDEYDINNLSITSSSIINKLIKKINKINKK